MSRKSRIIALAKRLILPKDPPSHVPVSSGPIVIAGMFRTANGIGEAARRIYHALRESDLDVRAVDTSLILNQVDLETHIAFETMPASRSGTLILIANPPEIETVLFQLGMRAWKRWRIIGYWSWELSKLESSWIVAQRFCSEIWTLSEFANLAISRDVKKTVTTIPIPVVSPQDDGGPDQGSHMRCLIIADGRSSFERKNVLGAVRIYLEAYSNVAETQLTVKLRNASPHENFKIALQSLIRHREDIEIIDLSMTDSDKWNLINEHDVIISAHRAQGFGLHLAEAMALGKCVIATNWSGNLEFMTDENSILLPYALQPVEDSFGVYQHLSDTLWAAVDEQAGAAALRRLNTSEELRQKIGSRAKQDIELNLSNRAIRQKMLVALNAT